MQNKTNETNNVSKKGYSSGINASNVGIPS